MKFKWIPFSSLLGLLLVLSACGNKPGAPGMIKDYRIYLKEKPFCY